LLVELDSEYGKWQDDYLVENEAKTKKKKHHFEKDYLSLDELLLDSMHSEQTLLSLQNNLSADD
jgi:hypothetical protein